MLFRECLRKVRFERASKECACKHRDFFSGPNEILVKYLQIFDFHSRHVIRGGNSSACVCVLIGIKAV